MRSSAGRLAAYKNWPRVKTALIRTFDPRSATGHQVNALIAAGWPEGGRVYRVRA